MLSTTVHDSQARESIPPVALRGKLSLVHSLQWCISKPTTPWPCCRGRFPSLWCFSNNRLLVCSESCFRLCSSLYSGRRTCLHGTLDYVNFFNFVTFKNALTLYLFCTYDGNVRFGRHHLGDCQLNQTLDGSPLCPGRHRSEKLRIRIVARDWRNRCFESAPSTSEFVGPALQVANLVCSAM